MAVERKPRQGARDVDRDGEPRLSELEIVGLLASGMAHDLNNLLVGVHECLALALSDATPPDVARQGLEEAAASVGRGRRLVEQVFAFARGDAARSATCHLDGTTVRCLPALRRQLPEGVNLETRLEAGEARVFVHPSLLEQILFNLCKNAADAMPSGGSLMVSTAFRSSPEREGEVQGRATLSVRDRGVGMDEATLLHAMDPFFTTKPQGRGMGLGLATVRGIVERVDGRVEIHSAPGEGTLVQVTLPCVFASGNAERREP